MAVPPRKIRQLPPALPPKDSDVFAISQMGDDGVPTTRAMQRAQFQQDIIDVIAAARQQFVDTSNAEHAALRSRLDSVESGLAANTLNDEQMQAVLIMVQQMVNGESGKTPYDLWLENGNTGTMQDYLNSLVGPRGPQGEKGDSIKGDRGERGETGLTGVGIQGPSGNPGKDGVDGKNGADGKAATIAVGSVTSGSAPAVTNSGTSSAAVFNFVLQKGEQGAKGADSTVAGPRGDPGPAGSDALATPLATTAPAALAASAAVGTGTTAARADHVHPLPSGRLAYVGDINVTETLLVSLALGMKRKTFTLNGIAVGDKLQFTPAGTPTAGCEVVNINSTATANQVSVGYYTPLLGIGATYTMPISIYKIT